MSLKEFEAALEKLEKQKQEQEQKEQQQQVVVVVSPETKVTELSALKVSDVRRHPSFSYKRSQSSSYLSTE